MSRFRISHPRHQDVHAIAGHDHLLGFFVEIFRGAREKPFKSLDAFTTGKPVTLQACLDFLIANGFFTVDQLQDVLVCLQDGTKVPKRLERVAQVVRGFINYDK